MSDQKRNDLLKQMQDMEDGTGGGGGLQFIDLSRGSGEFVCKNGAELLALGTAFSAVILLVQKSLTLFPEYREDAPADEKQKPILSTSAVIGYDDLAEDRVSKEVRTFGEWKNMHSNSQNGRFPKTQMHLSVLRITADEEPSPSILRFSGFSINPQNPDSLFSHLAAMKEKHGHASLGLTQFVSQHFTTDDGKKVFYAAFADAGPVAENHLAVVAEEKRRAVGIKIKNQERLAKLRHSDTQTHPPVSDADVQPSIPF